MTLRTILNALILLCACVLIWACERVSAPVLTAADKVPASDLYQERA